MDDQTDSDTDKRRKVSQVTRRKAGGASCCTHTGTRKTRKLSTTDKSWQTSTVTQRERERARVLFIFIIIV